MSVVTALHHLSHSQVQTFTLCPRKWHYDKIEHAPKERMGSALVLGISVHDALASVNESAIHGETIDAQSVFIAAWKKVAASDIPIHFGKDDANDLIEKGKALVALYQPPSGIIGVEQAFTVDLDPDLPPIEGRIDLIRRDDDGNLVLSDLKTSGTRMLTDTHAVEAQMGLYDMSYPAVKHEAIVLGKLKTPTITFQPIVPWNRDRVRQHYQEVHHAMTSGVRFANRGWQCDGCQFRDRCAAEC